MRHFGNDVFYCARMMASGYQRNGAESAEAVAAFRNLDICIVWFGRQFAVPFVAGRRSLPLGEFRDFFFKLFAVSLAETAHDIDTFDVALRFGRKIVHRFFDRFLLGITDEAAGVDYHVVGCAFVAFDFVAFKNNLESGVEEATRKLFAVYEVLGAPHAHNCNKRMLAAHFSRLPKRDSTNARLSNS